MINVEAWMAHEVAHWGYWAVFFGVMIESAGVPLPGETIVVFASVEAARGGLQVGWVYGLTVLAAVIGDNAGYAIGRWGGRSLLLRVGHLWGLSDAKLDEAAATFRRYGGRAVFFGRFVSLLRMLAGPIAGIARMPWPRFLAFNAAGAIAWAAVVVGLSFALGPRLLGLLHQYHSLAWLLVAAIGLWIYLLHRKSQGERPLP